MCYFQYTPAWSYNWQCRLKWAARELRGAPLEDSYVKQSGMVLSLGGVNQSAYQVRKSQRFHSKLQFMRISWMFVNSSKFRRFANTIRTGLNSLIVHLKKKFFNGKTNLEPRLDWSHFRHKIIPSRESPPPPLPPLTGESLPLTYWIKYHALVFKSL